MPVTNEQLEHLVDFDGKVRIPDGHDSEGNINAWQVQNAYLRGKSWDEVLEALGPIETGKWVTRLTLGQLGDPKEARLTVLSLAEQDPQLPNEVYLGYVAGMNDIPAIDLAYRRAMTGGTQ